MSAQDRVREIEAMHAEYVRLTGQHVSLMGREHVWYEWMRRGLTIDDLRMLIGHIKRERAKGNNVRGADLKFRNLVWDADFAEEDIVALRARYRGQRMDAGKAGVLAATGRSGEAEPASGLRQAGEVAAELTRDPEAARKALADFERFRAELKGGKV